MKRILITMLLIFPLWGLGGCSKDDDQNSQDPVSQLPEATQTGENTFGCLLNGEVFLPDKLPNSYNCFYQIVDGEYFFTVRASNSDENFNSYSIAIKTEKKEILQGETYPLVENNANNAFGFYGFNNMLSYTNSTHTGELTITYLDENIVSGAFWFDIEDHEGIVHQVREGRFDMKYTN